MITKGSKMAERIVDGVREREEKYKISIVGRNLQVTYPMHEHIIEKISKIEAITPQVIDVHVHLEIQKNEQRAEILYQFSHFHITTHGVKGDMYQAFDLACTRLKKKLRKWKTQIQNHHSKTLSEIELNLNVLDHSKVELNEINDMIEEETLDHMEHVLDPPKIRSVETRKIPMLTMCEAAMRMELSEEPFLVYRCEEDQKLKVMYLGKDQTLGVLEMLA